jgi:hypothetical protein
MHRTLKDSEIDASHVVQHKRHRAAVRIGEASDSISNSYHSTNDSTQTFTAKMKFLSLVSLSIAGLWSAHLLTRPP